MNEDPRLSAVVEVAAAILKRWRVFLAVQFARNRGIRCTVRVLLEVGVLLWVVATVGCDSSSEPAVDSTRPGGEPRTPGPKADASSPEPGRSDNGVAGPNAGAGGAAGAPEPEGDPPVDAVPPVVGGAGGSAAGGTAGVPAVQAPADAGVDTGNPDPGGVPWPPEVVPAEGAAAESANTFDGYAQCSLDSACPPVEPSGADGSYDSRALRCVLDALWRSEPGFLKHVVAEAGVVAEAVLLVHPVRIADLVTRIQPLDAGAAEYSAHELCTLAPTEYFESCLDALPEEGPVPAELDACANAGTWFASCGLGNAPVTPCPPQ